MTPRAQRRVSTAAPQCGVLNSPWTSGNSGWTEAALVSLSPCSSFSHQAWLHTGTPSVIWPLLSPAILFMLVSHSIMSIFFFFFFFGTWQTWSCLELDTLAILVTEKSMRFSQTFGSQREFSIFPENETCKTWLNGVKTNPKQIKKGTLLYYPRSSPEI